MKKILSIALAFIMLFTLVACRSGETENNSNSGTSSGSNAGSSSGNASGNTSGSASGNASGAASGGASSGTNDLKVFYYGSDVNSPIFDPVTEMQTDSGYFLKQAAAETMWKTDENGNIVKYLLAESAEWTDDLTLTIKLRDGVKFHNGNPLTAEDVLFTLEYTAASMRTRDMVARVDFDNIVIEDDHLTIHIPFTDYDAVFISTFGAHSYCIIDKETYDEDPGFSWFNGTGPYRLAGDGKTDMSGWVESVHYYLVRNENYWGDAPYYDEIYCKFYSEESTRYAELMAGNLDAATFSNTTYLNNLGNGAVPNARLVINEMGGAFGITTSFNPEKSNGSLTDINIRKAIAHGIDIRAIIENLGEGVYPLATSIVGEGCWAYQNVGVYEYNPELAAQYLAEAGYSTANPLTLRLLCETNYPFYVTIAEAVQAYLLPIGINVDLSGIGEFSTILPLLLASELEIGIRGPTNHVSMDPGNLLQQMAPSAVGMTSVDDSRLSELFLAGISERDQNKRLEIYKEFQQRVHDLYIFIPIYIETLGYGVLDKHQSFENALDSSLMFNPCLLTD